jgi:hypothetical protein
VLETSAFVFASDLAGEGIETVLDNLERRAGLTGVTPAFAYHAARDVFPRNPLHRVVLQERGALLFPPDLRLYAGGLVQPAVSASALARDVLGETCRAAAARNLAVHAWTVFLHPDRAGDYPSCSPQNAFGDLNGGEFCPANPDARAYVRALAADVCRYEVESIVAESLHYHGLEHGYHHERYLISLDPVTRFLLGLCFCAHCLAAGNRRGVDTPKVHAVVRADLESALAEGTERGPDDAPTRSALAEIADGELLGYLDARAETISSLVAEAAEVVEAHGRRLVFLDFAGAIKGYATGRPTGGPAAEISWLHGIDIAEVARSCHGFEAIAYVADPERLRLDIETYLALIGGETPFGVCLRPSPPDCENAKNLANKLSLVRSLGVGRADFYHYGFLRLSALDWIRTALVAEPGTANPAADGAQPMAGLD